MPSSLGRQHPPIGDSTRGQNLFPDSYHVPLPRLLTCGAFASDRLRSIGEAMICGLKRAKCDGCKDLWKELDMCANPFVHASASTDGSTFPKRHNEPARPSGAAFVFLEDGFETRDLWGVPGYGWQISLNDNYVAEMAAIHKTMRSVPVNVSLTIYTDSSSTISAIESALRCTKGLNMLRRGGASPPSGHP